jgi:hypothetical protein
MAEIARDADRKWAGLELKLSISQPRILVEIMEITP